MKENLTVVARMAADVARTATQNAIGLGVMLPLKTLAGGIALASEITKNKKELVGAHFDFVITSLSDVHDAVESFARNIVNAIE